MLQWLEFTIDHAFIYAWAVGDCTFGEDTEQQIQRERDEMSRMHEQKLLWLAILSLLNKSNQARYPVWAVSI